MEAGGIEPPSRGTSVEVSTCVVGVLSLDRRTPIDRLSTAQLREVSPACHAANPSEPAC